MATQDNPLKMEKQESPSQTPSIVVAGLGNMGMAMAKRFKDQGFHVLGYNRSQPARTEATSYGIKTFASVTLALQNAPPKTPLLMVMSNYQVTKKCLLAEGIIASEPTTLAESDAEEQVTLAQLMTGRNFCSACSGDPDQARAFAAEYGKWMAGKDSLYMDACYMGGPSSVLKGAGAVLVSGKQANENLATEVAPLLFPALKAIGQLTYVPGMGASKALDYAAVDMFLINVVGFLSGLSLLDAEGVDPKLLIPLYAARMSALPHQLESMLPELKERVYHQNVQATLRTWLGFLEGRRPYLQRHGLTESVPAFMSHLVREATQPKYVEQARKAHQIVDDLEGIDTLSTDDLMSTVKAEEGDQESSSTTPAAAIDDAKREKGVDEDEDDDSTQKDPLDLNYTFLQEFLRHARSENISESIIPSTSIESTAETNQGEPGWLVDVLLDHEASEIVERTTARNKSSSLRASARKKTSGPRNTSLSASGLRKSADDAQALLNSEMSLLRFSDLENPFVLDAVSDDTSSSSNTVALSFVGANPDDDHDDKKT